MKTRKTTLIAFFVLLAMALSSLAAQTVMVPAGTPILAEFQPEVAKEMICGHGHIEGRPVAVVANQRGIIKAKDGERPRFGGIVYTESAEKVAYFIENASRERIPLLFVQDVSGFMVGPEAEHSGIIRAGAKFVEAMSTAVVPKIVLTVNHASGAGYYAMAGMPYEPIVQLSTPITRLSVMEGRTLAIATYNTKLDDEFEIETKDPEERAAIEKGMREVESRIEGDMDPYKAAAQMDTDEIVSFDELRSWLELLAETAYQSVGHRRVKNPRIWSLHDVEVLSQERG